MTDAFIITGLEEKINDMRKTVNLARRTIENRYNIKKLVVSSAQMQDEVIGEMKKTFDEEFQHELNEAVKIWISIKQPVLNTYTTRRLSQIKNELKGRNQKYEIENYLKIAVRGNESGSKDKDGNYIFDDSISEHWIDNFVAHLPRDKFINEIKYLSKPAQRKQAVIAHKSLFDFPVSVKETRINRFMDENSILDAITNKPGEVLPGGIIRPVDDVIVASNVIKIFSGNEQLRYNEEGVKFNKSEAKKHARYVVGLRQDHLFDGIRCIEVVQSKKYIDDAVKGILLMGHKNPKIDFRIHNDYKLLSKSKQYHAATEGVVSHVMNFLKDRNFLERYLKMSEKERKDYRHKTVFGNGYWFDINELITGAPIEIQLKDELGMLVYTFNATPFSHNGKVYNKERTVDITETAVKKGYDKILDYVSGILIEAFDVKPPSIFTP